MKWTFEQLNERANRGPLKTLTLDGWAAPHGRPRQRPVIKELIKSRVSTTRYPGQSGPGTRHSFGTHWEDFELVGRWMTKDLARSGGTAQLAALDWTGFIQDERTCRISWGAVVSYLGFMEELEIARESEHEIAYRMKFLIDKREDAENVDLAAVPPPIDDNVDQVLKQWAALGKLAVDTSPDWSPDFFDKVNGIVSLVNQPAAEFNKFVGKLEDIEGKSFSAIRGFQNSISGFNTGILELRDAVVDTALDTAVAVRTAVSDVRFFEYQFSTDSDTYAMAATLADLDRHAELAGQPESVRMVFAREGDSWETLAARGAGDPSKAADLRSSAGAKYGEQPEPGTGYLVP